MVTALFDLSYQEKTTVISSQAAVGMFGYMTELHTVDETATETIEAEGAGKKMINHFHFHSVCCRS